MDQKLYNADSIQSLDPREFCRLRPGVYAGDTTYATQLAQEVFANSLDEYCIGHGDTIEVNIDKDIVEIRDNGQGFLINHIRPEDGKTIFEASLSVMNTSGKYDNETGVYQGTSLGLNGMGSKLTNYLSHWMEAITYRNGKYEKIIFEEGLFKKRELGNWSNKTTSGTNIKWQPSEEFFTHTQVEIDKLKKLFKTIVCLNPGLTVKLNYNGEETIYYSKNGLNDLADETIKSKEILKNRLNIHQQVNKTKLDLVLSYTSDYSPSLNAYVNNGATESGPHITLLKAIITKECNKFFRAKGWLKEKDENLSGDDLNEGLYIVFNLTAPGVKYDAQIKSRIVGIDTKDFSLIFNEAFKNWLEINNKEIKAIADKALIAREAREKARKAREAVRNNTPKMKSAFLNLPTKLVDAWSKKRNLCELYICEGDSAANGLVTARNGEFQAIFPIRGKIISCRKQSSDKIYANQEVANIVKALGLEIDKKTGKLIYNTDKLRYGKIIFAADADPDGESIKNLLVTCFWWLCPELFTHGHIYVAVPPLFRITNKKNEYLYLRDSKALEEYKNKHDGEKFQINRAKGLGEQDPEELEINLLDIKTRNIQMLEVSDIQKTDNLLEILMGPSVPPRREYLLKYGEEANNEY